MPVGASNHGGALRSFSVARKIERGGEGKGDQGEGKGSAGPGGLHGAIRPARAGCCVAGVERMLATQWRARLAREEDGDALGGLGRLLPTWAR